MRNRLGLIIAFLFFAIALAAPHVRAQSVSWVVGIGSSTGYDVAVDGSGNIYVTGVFAGTADFDPGPGTYNLTSAGASDIFVAKLDSGGTLLWAVRMGGPAADQGYGIAVDGSGNAYVIGNFQLTADFGPYIRTTGGRRDIFAAKLDSSGDVLWATHMVGSGDDYGFGIGVDGGGNAYVTGQFTSTVSFGSYPLTAEGDYDGFVAKLDSSGDVMWALRMGGPGDGDYGYAIAVDASGSSYVTGSFSNTADFGPYPLTAADSSDIFAVSLDDSGTVQWAEPLDGGTPESGRGIGFDGRGNVYVSGYSITTHAGEEVFVAKLDGNGDVQWAKSMGGAADDFALDLAVDASGNVQVLGGFRATLELAPYTLTAVGGFDVFVAKLDSSGSVRWAERMGGAANDIGYRVSVDGSGNVYLTGDFTPPADFGPYTLTAGRTFVAKLSQCGANVDDARRYGRFLFPPLCTRDAGSLTQDVYDSTTVHIHRAPNDRFFLSSDGISFAPLAVDDAIHLQGEDAGFGPYDYQPPYGPETQVPLDVPIETVLVPQMPDDEDPAIDLIPEGRASVLIELLDVQGDVFGSTAVFLLRDCGTRVEENAQGGTRLHWVSYAVEVDSLQSDLDVASGLLSELRADGNFLQACNLGTFIDSQQAADDRPDPPPGDGYYYLISGTCGTALGYGNSSAGPRTTCPHPLPAYPEDVGVPRKRLI